MPDLGDYAFEILMSYGLSVAFILVLVAWSVAQGRRAKAALQRIEKDG